LDPDLREWLDLGRVVSKCHEGSRVVQQDVDAILDDDDEAQDQLVAAQSLESGTEVTLFKNFRRKKIKKQFFAIFAQIAAILAVKFFLILILEKNANFFL
jgi:hypothetical protein